jgi:hypothetical protein
MPTPGEAQASLRSPLLQHPRIQQLKVLLPDCGWTSLLKAVCALFILLLVLLLGYHQAAPIRQPALSIVITKSVGCWYFLDGIGSHVNASVSRVVSKRGGLLTAYCQAPASLPSTPNKATGFDCYVSKSNSLWVVEHMLYSQYVYDDTNGLNVSCSTAPVTVLSTPPSQTSRPAAQQEMYPAT